MYVSDQRLSLQLYNFANVENANAVSNTQRHSKERGRGDRGWGGGVSTQEATLVLLSSHRVTLQVTD